jgi:hypothetical protein
MSLLIQAIAANLVGGIVLPELGPPTGNRRLRAKLGSASVRRRTRE